jgi:hypothetical protein
MDGQLTTGFYRTTKAGKTRSTHYHILYLNPEKGEGSVSINLNHGHELDWADTEAGPQPMLLASQDGHTHDIGEPIPENRDIDEDETDVVADARNLFKETLENESDYRKRGEESEEFVSGFGQWEKRIKDKLKDEERAALTINEIEPKLDILSGHQRQNRLDIKFYPVEEGDSVTADILNVLTKNIMEQNNYNHEETEAFEDSMITGRGNFNVRVDYEKNIEGDIIVEWFPWRQVFYGPHQSKDLKDLDYLVKAQWHTKAFIKNMWPDKSDQIQAEFDDVFSKDEKHLTTRADQYESPNAEERRVADSEEKRNPNFVDIAKKKFRVLEIWRRMPKTVKILTNSVDGIYENTEFWSKNDVTQAATLPGFNLVPVKKPRMRVTTIANRVLLEDEYPKLAAQDFHIIPVYGKKRGTKIWGKVDNAKDPQREINKRHSQAVDILNRMAAYGWFIDDQTFLNLKEQKNFEDNSSRAGFVQKVRDVKNVPVKVEGAKFPTELANYEQLASTKMKEIMNVNTEMLGMPSGAGSGIQEVGRRRQGLIGNEFLFDNLALAKRKLGRMLAAYIQDVYTVERMIRILENQATRGTVVEPQNIQPGSEMAQILAQSKGSSPRYDTQVLQELLTNMDLTKYDVEIGESAYSPTNRQSNFIIWLEAAKVGVPVPPDLLIDLSDLPEKDKVKQQIQQMQMAQQMEAEKTRQVELAKSGINPQTMTKTPGEGEIPEGGE